MQKPAVTPAFFVGDMVLIDQRLFAPKCRQSEPAASKFRSLRLSASKKITKTTAPRIVTSAKLCYASDRSTEQQARTKSARFDDAAVRFDGISGSRGMQDAPPKKPPAVRCDWPR